LHYRALAALGSFSAPSSLMFTSCQDRSKRRRRISLVETSAGGE